MSHNLKNKLSKGLICIFLCPFVCGLISWNNGDRWTIASVAQRYILFPVKKKMIDLLGKPELADFSTLNERTAKDAFFHSTQSWRFIRVKNNLTYDQFSKIIQTDRNDNIYKEIIKCENQLTDQNLSEDAKANVLKHLIILVIDAHDPSIIFISKTGKIKSVFPRQLKMNIDHGIMRQWDSKQLAARLDSVSISESIRLSSNYDPMVWLFESYQLQSRVIANPKAVHPDDVATRMQVAALRLAGTLNHLIPGEDPATMIKKIGFDKVVARAKKTMQGDLLSHIGDTVVFSGKVFDDVVQQDGTHLLLLNGHAPNQALSILITSKEWENYVLENDKPLNQGVIVYGKVVSDKGKLKILVDFPYRLIKLNTRAID